ncbi:MAG TPA: DUF1552 domain-containing protein [Polyangiaceae bacterium]|nr:DUF1552 domain-containing protein [Polyangiaceae bacterium]
MNLLGKFKLDRRTVLRGAGSIAIALPWLEVMGTPKVVQAQSTPKAKRFLTVYQPGGTVAKQPNGRVEEKFWPTTAADGSVVLSPILAPLQPAFPKMIVPKGLSMTKIWHKLNGEQHQAGITSLLTGQPQPGSGKYPKGPSIDQVLAKTLSQGKKLPSLQMAVRWATGTSNSKIGPQNAANFADTAENLPLPPELDPQKLFKDLFGTVKGMGDDTAQNAAIARNKSILDYVQTRYTALSAKLGARDKARLDEHLTQIREFETGLDKLIQVGGACEPPAAVDTTGYNPTLGTSMSMTTDEVIPKTGTFMMDMMVMALACEITAVGSFQWTDTEAKHTFPWLKLSNHHHYYQHDGNDASKSDFVDGYAPGACEQICTWYSQMHAHLLTSMDKIDMGGHTLLDETLVFFGTEIAFPPQHLKENMPFMLAGGGIKGGQVLNCGSSTPHNNLLVSIFNHFGDPRTTFGDAEFCQNPLPSLTG